MLVYSPILVPVSLLRVSYDRCTKCGCLLYQINQIPNIPDGYDGIRLMCSASSKSNVASICCMYSYPESEVLNAGELI